MHFPGYQHFLDYIVLPLIVLGLFMVGSGIFKIACKQPWKKTFLTGFSLLILAFLIWTLAAFLTQCLDCEPIVDGPIPIIVN